MFTSVYIVFFTSNNHTYECTLLFNNSEGSCSFWFRGRKDILHFISLKNFCYCMLYCTWILPQSHNNNSSFPIIPNLSPCKLGTGASHHCHTSGDCPSPIPVSHGQFLATETANDEWICIKFVHQYLKDVHEFCASKGFAPKLEGFEGLPGGWHMVVIVMDIKFFSFFFIC